MTIREIKKEDFDNYLELKKQLFDSEMETAKKDSFIKFYIEKIIRKEQLEEFSKMLKKEDSIFIVAEENKEIIGFLFGFLNYYIVNDSKRKFGYLDTMVISKKYRGKGVGTKLHQEFIEWLKFKKIKWAVLQVDDKNYAGVEFYKKEKYYPTELRMAKKI